MRSRTGSTRRPVTKRSEPGTTIATISGPATTPLITADQNRAFIGSIGENTIPAPSSVAPASGPTKRARVHRLLAEADRPAEFLAHGISGRAGQGGHRQQAGADDVGGEHRPGELAGDRA